MAPFASVFRDLFASVVLVPKNWCKRSQLIRLLMSRKTRIYSGSIWKSFEINWIWFLVFQFDFHQVLSIFWLKGGVRVAIATSQLRKICIVENKHLGVIKVGYILLHGIYWPCLFSFPSLTLPLCPIHVVTFTLISILPTDYFQKRRGQVLLFSFEYDLLPKLISK